MKNSELKLLKHKGIQWKHRNIKNIEIKIVTCEKCWNKNCKMQKISKQTQLNVKNI